MRKKGLVQGEYRPINSDKYKGRYPVIYRSSWELRLMRFFDVNENVVKWTSESIIIPYFNPVTSRTHRYFPDFSVEYYNKDGILIKEIIEVKPSRERDIVERKKPPTRGKRQSTKSYMQQMSTHIKNDAKWEAAKFTAARMGYRFRVITEKELF